MSLLQERLNLGNNAPDMPQQNNSNSYSDQILENTYVYEPPDTSWSFPIGQKKREQSVKREQFYEDSADMSEEMLEAYELKQAREDSKKERQSCIRSRIINSMLVFACIYIIFLIYGVVVTNYRYDNNGKIVPQIMSVSDISEKKQFDVILGQYENCRLLYEEVLMLDYRLGEGVEDPLTIAPQYEELLDDVENLSIKIDALDPDTKYMQIKEMLLSWVQNDIAIYLQKMSSAISRNNADDANTALAYKSQMYDSFSLITENVVVMGEKINGTDVTELKKWSPDTYISNAINGKQN